MKFKDFKKLAEKINQQAEAIQKYKLFETNCDIWGIYLENVPNPQFHNCNTCREFIENFGSIVGIDDDLSIHTIWDIEAEYPYNMVIDTLRNVVLSSEIIGKFIAPQYKGERKRHYGKDDGNHFFVNVDARHIALMHPRKELISNLKNRKALKDIMKGIDKVGMDSIYELARTDEEEHIVKVHLQEIYNRYKNNNAELVLWYYSTYGWWDNFVTQGWLGKTIAEINAGAIPPHRRRMV